MSKQASERLLRLNDRIMKTWEKRAIEEVAAAVGRNSLVLQNSIPEFLKNIAQALDTTTDRTNVRVQRERHKAEATGKKHGQDRAREKNYTMDQLIFEYSILRQVMCEIVEEEALLSPTEREVIVCAVEHAVNDAATEFSEIFSDIQEKLKTTLAHDLRNPLSSAKMAAQLLQKDSGDVSEIPHLARQIVASMDRIDQMIHDLLDGSKLRAGERLSMVHEECDLNVILKQSIGEFELLNPSRIVFQSAGPLVGHWNANGLRRVIDN